MTRQSRALKRIPVTCPSCGTLNVGPALLGHRDKVPMSDSTWSVGDLVPCQENSPGAENCREAAARPRAGLFYSRIFTGARLHGRTRSNPRGVALLAPRPPRPACAEAGEEGEIFSASDSEAGSKPSQEMRWPRLRSSSGVPRKQGAESRLCLGRRQETPLRPSGWHVWERWRPSLSLRIWACMDVLAIDGWPWWLMLHLWALWCWSAGSWPSRWGVLKGGGIPRKMVKKCKE